LLFKPSFCRQFFSSFPIASNSSEAFHMHAKFRVQAFNMKNECS
jgi:hypothetical protein